MKNIDKGYSLCLAHCEINTKGKLTKKISPEYTENEVSF